MFYSIGNIFTREPRQAEQTDTRQAIQRHDPEFQRPPQHRQEDSDEEFGEDFAHVSVEALSLFLKNFVKEQTADGPESVQERPLTGQAYMPQTAPVTTPQNGTANPAAAQAASAYQSMSHQAHRNEEVLIDTTDNAQGPALDLSAEDIRAINALIDDLEVLKQARIETLTIERAASFLESLKNAVAQAKSTL